MESAIRRNFKLLYLRKTVPDHSDRNHDTGKYKPTSCYIDQRCLDTSIFAKDNMIWREYL
jgi:hypothetical protein